MNYNYDTDVEFKIKVVDDLPKGWLSFGIGLNLYEDVRYLYIDFFRWSISIGFLY